VAAEIDETQLVGLSGHRHPLATPENMIGDVPSTQLMERMVLVLRPDPSQDAALEELIRAQQDPGSTYYHRWLTPQTFGEHYGISQNDLAQVANWLEMHGMKVEEIPASRRAIVFSGTAGQVESTFHTSLRKYSVQGRTHYANATDPAIPRALSPVVHGVVSLHDFHSSTAHMLTTPAYTFGNGANFLAPMDWDTIYDASPLYGQGLDGTGQSIAVLGRSDIALSDVQTFRLSFSLPANVPQIIINGADPGYPDPGDQEESTLDVEWAGAIARNATIKFVTSSSTATDGVVLSAQYAVTNNVAPIVTMSYGSCEVALGASGNAFWNGLWAQAASQGQSVFVAAGDSGAAGCDDPESASASQGAGVNGICSTPYSTCVGGTEFDDSGNPGAYWASTNGAGGASALSYIPEIVWNESASLGGLFATGGGVSVIYPKPSWQAAPGVPNDNVRDVPDVAMAAASLNAYLMEFQGGLYGVFGTSAPTPTLASVMALVIQFTGQSEGNINPVLYRLACQQLSSGSPDIFHDITVGNNSVPGAQGYAAGPGYDLATGLGSIDAFNLVSHWQDSTASDFYLTTNTYAGSLAQNGTEAVTINENAQGGFNSPLTLSVGEAPAGVTVNFSSPTLTTSAPVTATIAAVSSAVCGTYTLTIMATGGGLTRTLALEVTIVPPGFTLTPSSTFVSLGPGGTTSITFTIGEWGGFTTAVGLSVSGLPAWVNASFTPSSIPWPGVGTATLNVSGTSPFQQGTFTFTVTGTGGGMTKTQAMVVNFVSSSFNVSLSSTNPSVQQGASTSITVTSSGENGFNGSVIWESNGLPNGVTAQFSPSTIAAPGSGSSTLTLSASSAVAPGTYGFSVTGIGGGGWNTQVINLTILATPTAAAAPTLLSYSSQLVGASSTSQAVTLTDTSTVPLAITSLTFSGANSGDYSQTNNCGTRVSPGSSCSVYVMFTPSAGGSRSATLTINDNAAQNPQTVALSGTGQDFSIAPATGSSSSVTISAGQTGTYNLMLVPAGGLTGSVSFTCSGASSAGTCTVTPSQASLSPSEATLVTATVTPTTSAGMGIKPQLPPGPWIVLWMLTLLGVVGVRLLCGRHCAGRGAWIRVAMACLALTLMTACGTAGGGGLGLNSAQTPTTTYQFTVTGTYVSGGATLQRSVTLSLCVQ
jgi:subtilase family serine protease